jgi:hypothetical protein
MSSVNLQVGFQAGQAQDNSFWVSVTVTTGVTSFTWGVPMEKGERFLAEFVKGFKGAVSQARAVYGVDSKGAQLSMPTEDEMVHTCSGTDESVRSCIGCAVVRASEIDD